MDCNCGTSTVFCTIKPGTYVKNLVQELHREDERVHCGYLPVSASQLEYPESEEKLLELVVDGHRDVDSRVEEERSEEAFPSSSFSSSSSSRQKTEGDRPTPSMPRAWLE